ncbi:MAG TPA: ABC transporter ATP-binding protein, partial [Chloroflexia bacterium]|nr:ABC transporter ATP-binding protein [Chloroflexia bacterium]
MATEVARQAPAGLGIEHLTKIFSGSVKAVDDVSLAIEPGELVSFLGPSGCGKTTTLNCVAGLEHPDEGVIRIGDFVMTDRSRNISLQPEERGLGMVFQSYALWPHMSVADNVGFGLRIAKVRGDEARRRVDSILELVGLGSMGDRYPFQLSGGQQQRVALARAVVTEPRLLLLDEPLSNLDAKVREQARAWLREIQRRLGITTVYVTHDQAEALAMSDKIAVMHSGRVQQFATPQEIYDRPATRFVAEFIGATSFLEGKVVDAMP